MPPDCRAAPESLLPRWGNSNSASSEKKSQLAGAFPPVQAFVFVDEHAGSINDGYFQVGLSTYSYPDVPGSRHANACDFSFADGHAEVHKWRTPQTIIPEVQGKLVENVYAGPNNRDWLWLTNHSSIKN